MAAPNTPNIMRQGPLVPWLYILPALLIILVFIVYPTFNTILLSLQNARSTDWASTTCVAGQPCWGIFENYRHALLDELNTSSFAALWSSFWISSFGNNLKWILLMVSGSVGFGLLLAVIADKVRYESLAKSIIFLPMAISFVGAGVIWKFVYYFGTENTQIGLLNAIIRGLGGEPVSFLTRIPLNTLMLIIVGIWMWAGFCMVILSAAIKGVPSELLEAAQLDGASDWTAFWRITIPIILPTITVVLTTMTINTLKVFDIVFVMTGGNYSTDVIANRMYRAMYINQNTGVGTAVATILVVAIIPFMYMNIKRFREQEAMR
ncbi:MAG: sugar ABC transporter permease [Anaerolineales bacterium]|nr:sugar ABC transporter permease [Anaerolineales bacterium]